MTSAQSLHRKFGAVELPLVADGRQNFTSLDPARDILLDLFAAAIACELEPVWETAVSRIPNLELKQPVHKFPRLPEPEALRQFKSEFPLLAVGRSRSPQQRAAFSIDQRQVTTRWDIDYILCPLALAGELGIQDLLPMVANIIDLVVAEGGHRAYRTITSAGLEMTANVLGAGENCCNFYSAEIVESAFGPAAFAKDGPQFLAASATLVTIELSDFLEDGEDGESVPFDGATANYGYDGSGKPGLIART